MFQKSYFDYLQTNLPSYFVNVLLFKKDKSINEKILIWLFLFWFLFFHIHTQIYMYDFKYCLLILFSCSTDWFLYLLFVQEGVGCNNSHTSQAYFALSVDVTLALPPRAPSCHAPRCLPLSAPTPHLIKTFILFPLLLSQCHAAPLAISMIDISVCARVHTCGHTPLWVNVKEPRAECGGAATDARCSAHPLLALRAFPSLILRSFYTFTKRPVAFSCQGESRLVRDHS